MHPAPVRTLLHKSTNYRIETLAFGDNDSVVVSFALYTHPGRNFAEGMLTRYRQNAVFVTTRGPHWYQYDESAGIAALLATYCRRFERVVTFGVSMGGYAALAFSGAIAPTTVLAFSPQFSIDRRRVPFETRWGREADAINREGGFVFDRMDVCRRARVIIAYDPLDRDARHVGLIRAQRPIEEIRVPLSAHRTLKILAEMRLSSKLVLSAAGGSLDLAAIRAAIRPGRDTSITYLRHAARALHARRMTGAGDLLRRASALTAPEDLRNIRKTCQVAWRLGETALAAEEFLRALRIARFYRLDNAVAEFAVHVPAMVRAGLDRPAEQLLALAVTAPGPRAGMLAALRAARQARG